MFCTLFVLCFTLIAGAQIRRIDTLTHDLPYVPTKTNYTFNTDYLYTIAIKTYGLEQFPLILNQPSSQPYYHTYLNGLMFKFNNNQLSYRLQAAYFDREISFDNDCENCNEVFGDFRNTTFKVGIEKSLNYLRIQPYFGLDIGYGIQRFDPNSNQQNTEAQTQFDKKQSVIGAPFLGFKFYIAPRLALGAEATVNIAYSTQRTTDRSVSNPFGAQETTNRRWETFYAPITAITLQYNFGALNL